MVAWSGSSNMKHSERTALPPHCADSSRFTSDTVVLPRTSVICSGARVRCSRTRAAATSTDLTRTDSVNGASTAAEAAAAGAAAAAVMVVVVFVAAAAVAASAGWGGCCWSLGVTAKVMASPTKRRRCGGSTTESAERCKSVRLSVFASQIAWSGSVHTNWRAVELAPRLPRGCADATTSSGVAHLGNAPSTGEWMRPLAVHWCA